MKDYVRGANPYLPLWEHIPDGEPRVFEYQGEKRVYIYGSHDTLKTGYCGDDQVVWSAPVNDLTNWRYEGVCYQATDRSVLFAPDVVLKGDTFYLYAAEARGSRVIVAKSKNPAGPFTDPVKTELGFDPGILVDDDGRVYAYWGFCSCYCAELNEDMATIKQGTLHEHPIGHCKPIFHIEDKDHEDYKYGFFEASSPRKVGSKYVYLYSKRYDEEVPELGVKEPCNGFLSYVYSDKPLEGWKIGGDISFNGGEIIKNPDGTNEMTYRWGNNHGGIIEINGQWYVFYHRQTGTDEFSRQGMIEPIDVAINKKGEVFIGKVTYDAFGEPVSQHVVEMTSQGAQTKGLDAYKWIQAGFTCHLAGGEGSAFIKPMYYEDNNLDRSEVRDMSAPVVGITNGTRVGFRYLQFDDGTPTAVELDLKTRKKIEISVRIDRYDGNEIGHGQAEAGQTLVTIPISSVITGKHAVYFIFQSDERGELTEFYKFTFDKS